MCYECGCYGAVTPYGVGGSPVGKPAEAKGGVPPKFDRAKAKEENYEED